MLILEDIQKTYDSNIVFNKVSITIKDKSIVSVRGKNGTGKTTLLNIIGGLISFEGDVFYNNYSVKKQYNKYMSNIAFLSNDAFLYELLTLNEMIDFLEKVVIKSGREPLSHKNVCELIELLELDTYKDVYIKNLSLGTRQKVSVVINMLDNPKVILLDEPFVNLDEISVNNLLIYLKKYIEQKNAIMIYSTHSRDERLENFTTNELQIIASDNVLYS